MNKLLPVLLAFFIFYAISSSANEFNRKQELLNVIDEELTEVLRLNKQVRGRRPKLLLRVTELMLEKARIIKEIESDKYLTLSPAKRRKLSPSKAFRESNKWFKKVDRLSSTILKRFGRFKGISEVYYNLAYNAKEFNNMKKARSYFTKAIRHSRPGSLTRTKSSVALAEIYYNKKQYKKSIPLYKTALKLHKDKWWTKDAYNLAWCYFRTKRYSSAITLMHKITTLSKNPKFVDMSQKVENDLGHFYAEAGRYNDIVSLYKKRGKDITANLIKVSLHLIDKKNLKAAEKTLLKAIKYKENDQQLLKINILLLGLYERHRRYHKHLTICESLLSIYKSGQMSGDDVKVYKYNVEKMSSILQRQVVGKTYVHQKKIRNQKTRQAVAYFMILAELDPNNRYKSHFHAGETLYASRKFSDSIEQYNISLKGAQAKMDNKIAKLSLNGLMAALGQKNTRQSTKDKYLFIIYEEYLRTNPRSKKAYKIYQRLFSIYYDKKDMLNSESTLMNFKKHFPRALKTQEAMLARIMDYYKNKSDKAAVQKWATRIKKGEFLVSKKYGKKLNLLLITMQFENVENATSKGDKKGALAGYLQLYKSPQSDKSIKKNAAYNIAILFHELGDSKRTFGWAMRALDHMLVKDVKKFQDSFLKMASELFNRRQFKMSAQLNNRLLKTLCKTRSKNKKIFFKNANVIYLANNLTDQSSILIKNAAGCKIPHKYLKEAKFDLLKSLSDAKKWHEVKELLTAFESSKGNWPNLIYPTFRLYEAYNRIAQPKLAQIMKKRIMKYYRLSLRRKYPVPTEALNIIAQLKMPILQQKIDKLNSIKLSFPEKRYNRQLQAKFKQLERVTATSLEILHIGSGKGQIKTYRHLASSYQNFVDQIRSFTPPKKSKEYISSFKKSMVNITAPLLQKVKEYIKTARRKIKNKNILSEDNAWFFSGANKAFDIEYNFPTGSVIMDRGGAQ
ncbi:MAG: tetratricopeptide repeat protein [Bacteriovoracaceae bacterium]|nr:tetratricopeptide repeat protein [Bacteriovoracaceae bacterium]